MAWNSCSRPGRTRPSTYPTASSGMTLTLYPACQHGRVGAVADRAGHEGRRRAEVGHQLLSPQGAEAARRSRPPGRGRDGLDRGLHGRDQPDRPAMPADPRHRRAQPRHRVLRVRLGPVARPAPGRQPQPRGAPLRRGDGVQPLPGARVEGEGPRFPDRLGAALEQLRMPLDEPLRPELGRVLLVRGEREHDVPPRADPVAGPLADHREQHRVRVLHVHRAAPPQHAVADLAGERGHAPGRRVRGHHVEVPVHQQRRRAGVAAADPRHHVRAPGRRLQQRRLHPRLGQPGRHVLRRRALPSVPAAPVGRVDPDQIGGEPGGLGSGRRHRIRVIGSASSDRVIDRHRIRRPGGAGRPRGTRRRSGAWW